MANHIEDFKRIAAQHGKITPAAVEELVQLVKDHCVGAEADEEVRAALLRKPSVNLAEVLAEAAKQPARAIDPASVAAWNARRASKEKPAKIK